MEDLFAPLPALLLPWFQTCARDLPWRKDRDAYHVWLSEIMLQQTRVEAVKKYYIRFLAALPSVEALAAAPEPQVQKLWEGLGYYRRARNLQKAAQEIVARYSGVFPTDYASVRALPGIGDYTAGAICSICYGLPTPAVDGNVMRVISRLTAMEDCVDLPTVRACVSQKLQAVYPPGDCSAFTQSLMELGALVCLPNGLPHCSDCPLREICRAKQLQRTADFPVRAAKRERRVEEKTVFLLRCGELVALRRRPPRGLLAGLWELPNVPGLLQTQQALEQVCAFGCYPTGSIQSLERTHVFTHVQWRMRCYVLSCTDPNGDFIWVSDRELAEQYALPTAFRLFFTT